MTSKSLDKKILVARDIVSYEKKDIPRNSDQLMGF